MHSAPAHVPAPLVGALAVVLAAVGCRSAPIDSPDRDQFISQLCAEFDTCCAVAGLPADRGRCRAHYSGLVPAAGYDQVLADACLREIAALADDKCAWISRATPRCEQVFAGNGTAKPGESCEYEDCAYSTEGQVKCSQAVVNDKVCDFFDDLCKPRLALGADCANDDWCEAAAYCQDGTCAARRANGEHCEANSECLVNNCTNQTCGPSNEFALVFLCGEN
jgi:hypothetical protein